MNTLLKTLKYFMLILLSIVLILGAATFLYMRLPKFGEAPKGKRLAQLQQSPNFKNGKFENLEFTPSLTEGYSMLGLLGDMLFKRLPNKTPNSIIPSVKTDIKSIPLSEDVLIWFGHSSYFMQINGKRFLVDPVFSGNASPIPGTTKAFKGTDIYQVSDLPAIDYLIISHDHYDHLDYQTIKALKPKVNKVICALGVGQHFEYWGYKVNNLIEKDWNQTVDLGDNFKINTVPARHFSGRRFTRNNTLWTAYVLETPKLKLFIGGDSGYGSHFKAIGEKFGPIDLAILENGQYNLAWQAIHTLPNETLQAATNLQAKRILPVHSSKFALAMHDWNAPLNDITELNAGKIPLVTPKIGEPVRLNDTTQTFTQWWKHLK